MDFEQPAVIEFLRVHWRCLTPFVCLQVPAAGAVRHEQVVVALGSDGVA